MAEPSGLSDVLERIRPWFPDGTATVALSGGADSAATLGCALALGVEVGAVTVDHGRPESTALVQAAAAVASQLGVDHQVVVVDGGGSEDEMRRRRYAAIEEVVPDGALITGHTLDDQTETVLANLARGAGTSGLSGIPRHRGRWVRPMLDVRRSRLRALAEEWELPFVDDPTNREAAATRNRIRSTLLPAFGDVFGDDITERIASAAELAAIDDAALEAVAERVPVVVRGAEVAVPRHLLRQQSPAIASRVVRRALRHVLDPYPGTRRDVVAMLTVAAEAVDRLAISDGYVVATEGPWLVVHPAEPPEYPLPVRLEVPGSAEFGRWVVSATAHAEAPSPTPIGRFRVLVAPFDAATVRAVEPGDRIAMGDGTKSVAEALRESGVPSRRRPGWPAVDAGGRMLWLVGSRVAEWGRPTFGGPVVELAAMERAT